VNLTAKFVLSLVFDLVWLLFLHCHSATSLVLHTYVEPTYLPTTATARMAATTTTATTAIMAAIISMAMAIHPPPSTTTTTTLAATS